MSRLYVLMPNQESCKKMVEELKAIHIPEHHLHVVASLTQRIEGLPEASVWQKTELAHKIIWGIVFGGAAGLVGGVLAITFPPPGLVLGNDAMLAVVAAGAGVIGVISAILGSHEHSHALDRFRLDLARGRLLLMADIPRRQLDEVQTFIKQHHPEAQIKVIVN